MGSALAGNRAAIGAASLIVGPALMSAGDLFHPPENWAPATQVAIVAESASRWYAAHLLLFVGMILFIPGILSLTEAAASRRPLAGYAARLLMIASVGALSAVFVFEMVLGQFVSGRSDQTAAVALLETFQSGAVFGALLPGLLAFFIGTGLAVFSFASKGDPFRGPALVLALGAILIFGEIALAEVLLSQIGNILILVAGIGFARLLLQGRGVAPAHPTSLGRETQERIMERAVPVLPVDDLAVAKKFYVDALGFEVTFEASDNGTSGLLGVRRGSIALTLDCPMEGHGRDACVSLEVESADSYYNEWSTRTAIRRPPRNEEWGGRTFDVIDPFGNTLFVVGPVT